MHIVVGPTPTIIYSPPLLLSHLIYCHVEMAFSLDSIVIPSKPHQPLNFRFPKRRCGVKKVMERSFQPSWFEKWPFLHYDESKNVVLCHTCMQGFKMKLMKTSTKADPAFESS